MGYCTLVSQLFQCSVEKFRKNQPDVSFHFEALNHLKLLLGFILLHCDYSPKNITLMSTSLSVSRFKTNP